MMVRRRIRFFLVATMICVASGMVSALPPIQLTLATGAATLDGEAVGELSASARTRVFSWMDVQLRGTALHTLERSYQDAQGYDYQSETAWVGIGIRPFIRLGDRFEIGFPLESGNGIVQFRYERPYRDNLTWDEEILDREQIAVYSAGVDLQYRMTERWRINAEAGGRTSSPVRTVVDFDRGALTSWYARFGASYQVSFGD